MNDEYYSMEMGKDYLAHHGVKGMKWGIRHDPERIGRAKKKVKNLASTIARGFKKAAKGTYKVGKRGAKLAKKAKYKTKQYQIERAIASGKTQKINRLFSQMNDQQAARAITRMNQRQQIKNAKIQDISRSPRNAALQKKINNLNLQRQYTQAKHPILTRERDKAIDNVVNKASNEAANVAIKKVEKIMKMEVDSKGFDKEKFANDLKEEIVDSLKESDMVESGKDYLAHHGVKGMKWGIRHDPVKFAKRKEKTKDKINSLYDHANKWTKRKIAKLDAKGKTAKRDAMKYMLESNEAARKTKIKALDNMNADDYIKSRRTDAADFIFGGQDWIDRNSSAMTTFVGRWNEYSYQRGMRWASNFTREKTLKRFNGGKGAYNYLDRKVRYSRGYRRGAASH